MYSWLSSFRMIGRRLQQSRLFTLALLTLGICCLLVFPSSRSNAQPCIPYPDCLAMTPGGLETEAAGSLATQTAYATMYGTPLKTSTPSYNPFGTATPTASFGDGGCPPVQPDLNALEPRYRVECSRCWTQPTATAGRFGTKVPFPTVKFNTPTLAFSGTPTIDGVIGGETATLTPAPTNTPTLTPTPQVMELYWDFRTSTHGATVIPYDASSLPDEGFVNDGVYTPGYGFGTTTTVYHVGGVEYVGQFLEVLLPNDSVLYQPGMIAYAIYYYGDAYAGTRSPWVQFPSTGVVSGGSRGANQKGYNSGTDLRGSVLLSTYLGTEHSYITGISFIYNGYSPTPTLSPTPSLTLTPVPTLVDGQRQFCFEPVYRNTTPVVSGVSWSEFSYNCYVLWPAITIPIVSWQGVPHSQDIHFNGFELCVHWLTFPAIVILGITIDPSTIIGFGFVMMMLNYIMRV